ncbi:DUF4430 domain-containing protein [Streptococcus dentapri]|uniref:DUF4430 domain-containing protein n=1 Tax=Streptococcus dentapri TaxID=573564 RepID=A0ABV8CZ01_9STRE
MKKILTSLAIVLSLLLLVACGNAKSDKTADNSKADSDNKITLIIKSNDGEKNQDLIFKKGDTVMDVLKAHAKVEEKNGFITSINGTAQDESAGKYWMFKINDKLAPKAANQIKVKNGDKIEFYQDVYK